jgi:tRNA G10  N-methylase Trm11
MILELAQPTLPTIISALGGCVRIAKVISSDLESLEIYTSKFNYSISSIDVPDTDKQQWVEQLKKYFKSHKMRGQYKPTDGTVPPSQFHSWNLENGLELILLNSQGGLLCAQGLVAPDPGSYKKLDEQRPVRRFSHSSSFRLAQMMLNILGLHPGQTLVDPFCGLGTFLISAMLNGVKVIGIDNDPEMISGSHENLRWATQEFGLDLDYRLIEADSSQASFFQADGCAFEPYMGPFLKKTPSKGEAQAIVIDLTQLYSDLFKNLAHTLASKANVVCILPYFPTSSSTVELSEDIFTASGWKNAADPIEYKTPDGSHIGRKIYWLSRSEVPH